MWLCIEVAAGMLRIYWCDAAEYLMYVAYLGSEGVMGLAEKDLRINE